jgi:hypothetical protein
MPLHAVKYRNMPFKVVMLVHSVILFLDIQKKLSVLHLSSILGAIVPVESPIQLYNSAWQHAD